MNSTVFIHPTSLVSPKARIGAGTKVWQFCTVLDGACIGRDGLLSQNVYVEGRVRIGNGVKVKNNVVLFDGVTVDDDVFIGPCAVFTNVINPRSFISRKKEFLPTRIRRGATIGANATLICGITVGRYAFIGAGAVVTADVPDYALMLGVPARACGWMCRCGIKLSGKGRVVCRACRTAYRITDSICRPTESL